ncbi:RING-H2 finger protein ATL20-like [Euphorbia lathyris]|uniref:RING-H2 finger protein ATL20-like n=1 Tax=Euphorbia lathyris TaxID=212925 RepID=UPI003313B025
MALLITSLFIFLSFLNKSVTPLELCSQTSCSPTSQQIRFPFGLNSDNRRCSYSGFGLSCNNKNQTILTLPHAGTFIVRRIYYELQKIYISDPGNCLPRRFLDNFSLSESPFMGDYNLSFIFLNCSAQNVSRIPLTSARRVDCLSNENDTVFAFPTYEAYGPPVPGCRVVSDRVEVPVVWDLLAEGDTTLFWDEPDCWFCERTGGTCGFKDGSTVCHQPSRGLSRSGKYGILIGAIGIPLLLSIIVLGFYLCGKLTIYSRNRHSSVAFPHPPFMPTTGLDGASIELYPKTILGESRRLPKPNDNICPICLSEYQPKETLRTIPECNHYFHVECIDGWLIKNSACPLCRNSPDISSIATSTSTLFSSSSVTPSSPLHASSSLLLSSTINHI